MTGISSPGNPYLVSSSRIFHLDQVEQFRVVDQVDLVEEDDQGGHVHLAGQEHVLAGLRHGAVGGGDHQDGPVHLGGAGDHVLDVVGVAGAVDVGVVALLGLVLDVRDGDGHGLGGVADRAALGDFGVRLDLASPLAAWTARIAAVNVVLPWSMWPMVPTFTCGLVRLNTSFAIVVSILPALDQAGSVKPSKPDDEIHDGHYDRPTKSC